jgi:hypothetical protein
MTLNIQLSPSNQDRANPIVDRAHQSKLVRAAINTLADSIEVAIRSAGVAYEFTGNANSYTAVALADVVDLRNLLALVAGRFAVLAEDDQ